MRAKTVIALLATASAAAVFVVVRPAWAYVGPGAGVSLFGAAFGLIAAALSAVGFILMWPIRAFLKRRRAARANEATAAPGAPAGAGEAAERGHDPAK